MFKDMIKNVLINDKIALIVDEIDEIYGETVEVFDRISWKQDETASWDGKMGRS